MRVMLLGKGGSGKSSLAGLLSAALSGHGEDVVAIDADTVPGLAPVLGLAPTDEWSLAGMATRADGGWQLAGSPTEVVARCAQVAPNGIRFLQVGNADSTIKEFEFSRQEFPERWSGMMAFNTIARSFDQQDGWVVVDLQGGTLHVAGGLAGTAGIALVVVEPFAKSVLTARRFVEMGEWPPGVRLVGVANKVAGADDEAYLASELAGLGLPLWGSIPDDPSIQRAECAGQPLWSMSEESPAQRAVGALADRLREAARADRASATAPTE